MSLAGVDRRLACRPAKSRMPSGGNHVSIGSVSRIYKAGQRNLPVRDARNVVRTVTTKNAL